ncbi:MAG TPA: aminoglycoside phosphotransferase family protein [Ktedonobacteraceae bacterium]
MKYTIIERTPDTHQQPLSREQIRSLSERAFGRGKDPEEVQELDGGEYNNTYLMTFADSQQAILRVSPAPSGPFTGRGKGLMRNEHYFQPFLAPIATLMPKTLLVDFTHQLINRDYLFQTRMEGERWFDTAGELTRKENSTLWQQLGHIAKSIHTIKGEAFGSPVLGTVSPHWSTQVLSRLASLVEQLKAAQLDGTDLQTVQEMAQTHSALLDEIQQPRLLHGDLWTFNILIKRDQENPRITAVLDSDSCSWGDPMADWTMFLLHIKKTEGSARNDIAGVQAFWQAYGQPEHNKGARFREQIYRANHFAQGRLDRHRQRRDDIVLRTYDKLREILATLQDIIKD